MTDEAPPAQPETAPADTDAQGQEVAVVPHAPHAFMERQRGQWDPANVAVIKATVARDANDAEFAMFLELSASLGLNPLAKEIWCVKSPGKNGDSGSVIIIVGRDGMLRKAREWDRPGYGRFLGIKDGVVHANDHFMVEQTDTDMIIQHRFSPAGERGAIKGAYAKVMREGMHPTFFWADWSEYVPKSERKLQFSPWGSQASIMILKCAQVSALRLAFSITGVVGEGEMDRQLELPSGNAPDVGPEDYIDMLGDDQEVAGALSQAMDILGWFPAKRKARLAGLDAEGRDALLAELHDLVDADSVPEAEVVA